MGDTLADNFVTVSPDGTISFTFTGVVHAQGLTLDFHRTGEQILVNANEIDWKDVVDSSRAAQIIVQDRGVGQPRVQLDMNVTSLVGGDAAKANLALQADRPAGASAAVVAEATEAGGQFTGRTVLDSLGLSSFAQLTATHGLAVKGDLLAGGGSGFDHLAIGADNLVLGSDSAQADGLRWRTVVNAMVDAAAAIAYSKLNLAGSITRTDLATAVPGTLFRFENDNRAVATVPNDYNDAFRTRFRNATAVGLTAVGTGFVALIGTRAWSDQTGGDAHELALDDNGDIWHRHGATTVWGAWRRVVESGSIVNSDVAAGAAIAYSKLNLATSIVNADVASAAAIAYSKLNLATSIVNADVASGAAIALSKLAHLLLRGPDDATQYQFAFGTLAAVNSDGGGWLNYTIAPPWATATDFVIAVNNFGGTSGAGFLVIQVQTRTTFRVFVNAVGLNCGATWFAVGH